MTDISVSLVNTKNRELLLACLGTLQASVTADVEVEIVVLDNASDDGSAQAVRERFPDVRLIAQGFRTGFGANHNTIIRATDGRYIYVLNEDTMSEDWGFVRLVSEMDAHPRTAALGPRLVYPDGRRQRSAWRFPTPAVSLLGLPRLGKLGIPQSKGDRPRSVDWVTGAVLLIRREALEDVGLFDEDFFIYFEEVDLCLRLGRAGWEVCYFPGATVVHYESSRCRRHHRSGWCLQSQHAAARQECLARRRPRPP